MTTNRSTALALAALLLLCVSCATTSEADKQLQERNQQYMELAKKRMEREKELAVMSTAELADALQKDSVRGIEPFNSMPYREVTARSKESAAGLRAGMKARDRESFLGLLALRRVDPQLYGELGADFRVGVLIDALRTSKYFNAWGLPHQYWEDAAVALMNEGVTTAGPLKALLRDTRPAPMWGSEEVLEYEMFQYRVCDYAWVMLSAIRKERILISPDPSERDRLFPR